MPSLCILCKNHPPILNSHIFPKFVFKRLKEGNPVKTLVHSDALNTVFQDGWKGPYLCQICEDRFCKLEDWFCKHVYDPFITTGAVNVNYDKKLGLFAASLYFRYIYFAIEKNPGKPISSSLTNVSDNLRLSLLEDTFESIRSHSYLQFLHPVFSAEIFPAGINTYFFEAIDGRCFTHIVPPSETWLVFVKLQGMFFLLSERDLKTVFKTPSLLAGHTVLGGGSVNSGSQSGELIRIVQDDFRKRALDIQNNYSKMPAHRVGKMRQKIAGLPDKEKYRAHQSFLLDQKLLDK